MKALVTGGGGFVGGHLVKSLVGSGAQVRCLVRRVTDREALHLPGVELMRGDLTDRTAVAGAMRGCDVVYHLAGLTSRTGASRDACRTANYVATEEVAAAALEFGVSRMVFSSSASVYGLISHPPVDENSKTRAHNPYAETKLMAESALLSRHREHGLPVVIARYPGVLGYGSADWIGLFRAVAGGRFRMIGSGVNHTHVSHVEDIVKGLRLCGETGGVEGRIYNLASEQPLTVRELVGAIADEFGVGISSITLPRFPYALFSAANRLVYRRLGRELPFGGKYELFLSDKVMDIGRAGRELGFAPKIPLEDGIGRTVAWHREQGWL